MATELTPMMQQYLEVKEQYPEEILFFRLGDFYEMFFADAITASKELGLTLTSRSGDTENNPMCGIPYHASEGYIARLVAKGYKIAIAEQIGDPKAKGLTKREVVKVITPGTVLEDGVLKGAQNNYIALVGEMGEKITLAAADISTGECFYGIYQGRDRLQSLFDEIYRLMMPELIFLDSPSYEEKLKEFISQRLGACTYTARESMKTGAMDMLIRHFDSSCRPKEEEAILAVASLLEYLHLTLRTYLSHIKSLTRLDFTENLVLDAYTLRNLEIVRNMRDGSKKDTLLGVLDKTKTAMGTRLLKKWLEYPLRDIQKINQRLDSVEELVNNFSLQGELESLCGEIYDFERLLTRIEVGNANARDLVALRSSLKALPRVKEALLEAKSSLLKKSHGALGDYSDLIELLERSVEDEPGFSIREGGIIKDGYSQELDEYRRISRDSRQLLQAMEEKEREQTGIKSLKIGYNKVFGYYIEVRNSGAERVPLHYIRKQTLANAERYITEELKNFETKILGAQEKILALEYILFNELREKVKERLKEIQVAAAAIASIDVLASLARIATEYNYVRPRLSNQGEIRIRDGRHPLVERLLQRELFVPNDVSLNHQECELMLITGPNMAGKSTYMRQVALLTLMAQAGSFVPAREAVIGPVDRIFTRIGASDDLASGQSTFMMEMNEVAQILKYATKNSLVILDEIGRGTSTFDGMSIARAVIEHIRDKVHAKTLFATHYHELTDMEGELVKNFCVAVREKGKEVSFLRRIVAGAADRSYGIHVARLAGLPNMVTSRAESILASLEAGSSSEVEIKKVPKAREPEAMTSLFQDSIRQEIENLDIMSMTPLEALNKLYQLQLQIRGEEGRA